MRGGRIGGRTRVQAGVSMQHQYVCQLYMRANRQYCELHNSRPIAIENRF
jgi:hypothetical protein